MHETPDTTRLIEDRLDPARVAALAATLGWEATPEVGAALPPLAHLVYFWDAAAAGDLGADGHERLGRLIPDLGLPLRMWAGGRVTFHADLAAGVRAERTSRVVSTARKEGQTGKLAFVTLRHDVRQRNALVLSEEQDIVYREYGAPAPEPLHTSEEADERKALRLDAAALFRYSALTFNAHRIHFDPDYCREHGYPGLVVHGPLLATLLARMAEARLGRLREFRFRAASPLILGEVAWLCRAGDRYWVEGPRRRVCMTAEAR